MHYHSPFRSKVDLQDWTAAREILLDSGRNGCEIDIATFGTPLRYRWNREVVPRLLHFVQHRSTDDQDPQKAVLIDQDLLTAAAGDYVQHLGIAGTDFILRYLPGGTLWLNADFVCFSNRRQDDEISFTKSDRGDGYHAMARRC